MPNCTKGKIEPQLIHEYMMRNLIKTLNQSLFGFTGNQVLTLTFI